MGNSSVSIHTLHELEARLYYVYSLRHRWLVSIHTLHELEASSLALTGVSALLQPRFPFIRFTNWKQVAKSLAVAFLGLFVVSIHTLHELEARTLQQTFFLCR